MTRYRSNTKSFVTMLLATSVACAACIENTAYVTNERSDKVEKYILKKAPKPQKVLNVNLEGKMTMLGYDVKADDPKPGDTVEVTWYWKVHKEPGAGWRLFTHGIGDGDSWLNLDKHGDVRAHFQPEHWRKGMIIKDRQRIRIPKDWSHNRIELRTGLWRGALRLKASGKHMDNHNRIRGPRIKLIGQKKPPVTIPYTGTPPTIDGNFENEAVWKTAVKLDPLVNTMNGKRVRTKSDVYLLWDAAHLYVAAKLEDDNLESRYTDHDDELWKEDAFEVFIDPKGDKRHYYELQINPKGVIFDSYLPKYRKNQNDWSSKMVGAVQLDGTFNDDSDKDKSWSIELKIPFETMENGGGVPPKAGHKWRANFFRVDMTKSKKEYAAWSPPMRGDFHTLARFGQLVFGQKKADETEKSADEAVEKAGKSDAPAKAKKSKPSPKKSETPKKKAPEKKTKSDKPAEGTPK